jgi:hypothetical protein
MVTVSRLAGVTSAAFAASLLFSAQSVTHASTFAQGVASLDEFKQRFADQLPQKALLNVVDILHALGKKAVGHLLEAGGQPAHGHADGILGHPLRM